ncbi:MAG: DUF1499 domain-containing protein [Betaproteobacteria bacterium]|nr:DUF1499 domain-containing protein [Betaproteobacteria bacterium]
MARLNAAKHKRITLALAVLAVLLLAISGPGTRFGIWSLRVGVGMFGGALLLGLAAAGAAVVGLAIPLLRAGSIPILVAGLLMGAASAAVPLNIIHRLMTVPYINDITTDTEHPPQFAVPKTYPSYFGELQEIGYPDLHPLELALPPAQAFARAAKIAADLGWEVTTRDERAGRIEAVVTTLWFGFKDDVVIRITPAGAGSRVDMRSKSRFGRSDVGTNAHRIREFLAAMDARE